MIKEDIIKMNIKSMLKNFINGTDDNYIESDDANFEDDFDFAPSSAAEEPAEKPQPKTKFSSSKNEKNQASNVVNFSSSKPVSSVPKPHVVFHKIDRFEEANVVADVLNQKRIVILNLETCPNDVSQRILDFLYGVAYANHGEFKKVAGRAYIITPNNVPVSGELIDELAGLGEDEEY